MEFHAEAMDAKQAFRTLKAEERTLVSLAVFGGYKSREIGEILRMNPTTVRSRLKRSLDKMREQMEVSI